jgi:hypothetical protein
MAVHCHAEADRVSGNFGTFSLNGHALTCRCCIECRRFVCCVLLHCVCGKNAVVIQKHCNYHFASGPHNFGLFRSRRTRASTFSAGGFCPWGIVRTLSRLLSVRCRNSWPLREYRCRNDEAQVTCFFLWSSVIALCTQLAHTLLIPKSRMMMRNVPCYRFKPFCISPTVILLLLRMVFSMSALLSLVLTVVGLPFYSLASDSKFCT